MTDLEPIVAEVIRRLMAVAGDSSSAGEEVRKPTTSLASVGGTSGLPVTIAKTKYSPKGDHKNSEVFDTQDRLLTLATLEGKLEGLRRLVVHRKAIVTPALKEELARRGIELDRGGLNGKKKTETSVSVVRFDASRAPSLNGLGLAEEVSVKSLAMLGKTVASQLENEHRVVFVLTARLTAALVALNRHAAIRAAAASNVDSVKAASKAIAANVMVVDPGHLGRVQLAAMLRAFENEGVRSVPSDLKEVL